jgi:general secretion pathway protein G
MKIINKNSGFTLVEVVMVIIILGIIAGIAMKSLDSGLEATRIEETKNELRHLSMAISGNPELYSNGVRTDYGYIGDVGTMPVNLDALVSNPGYATWRGPYIHSDFTNHPDDFKQDAWGYAYLYTGGNYIRSTGMQSDTIDFMLTPSLSDFTANTVSGRITDAVGNPPGDESNGISVRLRYPNGAGGYKDSVLTPNSSGYFSFQSCVPIGNHTIEAVYASTNDTLISFVSVIPKSEVKTNLRFAGALWAADEGPGEGASESFEYIDGSGRALGSGNSNIQFKIKNTSDQPIVVTWIRVTYDGEAYYQIIKWAGKTVFNNSSPRAGSDDQVGFSTPQYVVPYAPSITLRLNKFKDVPEGGGSNVNMSGKDITIEFSDGSVINFST